MITESIILYQEKEITNNNKFLPTYVSTKVTKKKN